DAVQMTQVDRLERQAQFARQRDGLAFDRIAYRSRAVFDLKLLRATQRNLQAVRQIVRNVISAYREDTRVLDHTTGIHHVIRPAAANVNDERAEFFLLAGQQRE